jgi:hypothetical protein
MPGRPDYLGGLSGESMPRRGLPKLPPANNISLNNKDQIEALF